MQEKRTLYLAGKITGDPYYFTKFYNAQKKLEEGGFIVVNPALLPAEGFTWEAYMRMSGAMLAECAEVCFLPDWKESKGAWLRKENGGITKCGRINFPFRRKRKSK